jgi:type VI secretion system protein ImpA
LDVVDLASLLAPIEGELPAGTDPREDFSPNSFYFRLRDARSEARAAERQADAAEAGERPAPAQWGPVSRLAIALLQTQAKDLEAASWLTEALLRTDGLEGLAAGFQVMAGLVETYWDDLHPLPDDEGMARRVATVAGLNGEGADGTLIQPLRKIPLFPLASGEALAFWQYQQSAELVTMAEDARREQRLSAGVTPFDTVENAARANIPMLKHVRQSARACLAAWQAVEAAFDNNAEAPPVGRVRDLLDEIASVAERYAGPEVMETEIDTVATSDVAGPTIAGLPGLAAGGRVSTREEAFRMIEEVADFFHRTEPHSPLAYTLREAVRRGRLTWSELLEEIVPDVDHRAAILSSLGIRPPPSPE